MSSARTRIPPALGRVLRGVAWTVLLAVLAMSGAGLVGSAWHAPGGPARAELTYPGDTALAARLDVATDQLRAIAADVALLAQDAKTALGEVTSADSSRLRAALEHGGLQATAISEATRDLRESLAGLPGDGPTAAIEYSNGTLVRRAAILAAVDAAAGLALQWQRVTGRAVDAAHVVSLISDHDLTVLDAAAKGRAGAYAEAIVIVEEALLLVAEVQSLRERLIADPTPNVLDEWVERNAAYDVALRNVYQALVRSGGRVTIEVQAARLEEQNALAQLPPDRRTIIVIVAEVARGGLTQAVIAIEEAHGRIDEALAEAG